MRHFRVDRTRVKSVVGEWRKWFDAVPGYRRFRDHGRLAPDGLKYVTSFVTDDMTRCYQVMECDDRRLLDEWIAPRS